MTCDSGAKGTPAGDFVARINPWYEGTNDPLSFALFGLARQGEFPSWRPPIDRLRVLDLGPGRKEVIGAHRLEYPEYNFESPDFLPGDISKRQEVVDGQLLQMRYDARSAYRCCLPFPTESVGGIFAVNILEHLWDPRPIMEECARVLAPGAPMNIVVPYAHSPIYTQDLDHKKPFNLDSWRNWLSNDYWGPDRSHLKLRVGANFVFGIKEGNLNIATQLIKEA